MTNYDFNRELEPLEFQNFARDILQVRENKIMESFRTTKDGGIDMRTKIDGKLVIGQAKRYKDFKSLKNSLKDEIEKVKRINPERYILITSVEDFETENKQVIMDMFCGYIKELDDILGTQDLNNLLGRPEYKCVEINYMKLFLKTPNVLEYLLSDVVNHKIKTMSKNQLQEVFKNETTYINGDFFNDAKNILDENNCLLITGEAGVGKTSLAQHMCYELLLQSPDYKFYYVYSFEEILDVYNLEEKQIFFFDDFWGKFLKINNEDIEDKRMIDTICMILNDSTKKLILTSRGYIVDDILKNRIDIREVFENKKIEIKLKDFSEVFKSKILFSYLKESNLERKDILHICDNYRKIINHNMYNPRTVIRFLDKASKDAKKGIYYDYCDELVKALDNPEGLIEEIFNAQKEETKIILILLMLMNVETDINVLKQMYVDYSKIDVFLKASMFENAIRSIDGDLINVYKDSDFYGSLVMAKFKDPSVEEFVYKFFIKNQDEYIEKIVKSSKTLNLIVRVLGIINIFINEKEYTIQLSDKAKKIIASKIIEDYDELFYWYLPDFGEEMKSCRVDKLHKVLEVNEAIKSVELSDFVKKECNKEIENLLNNDDSFSNDDMFYVTDVIENIKHSNLNIELEPYKLIEGYIKNIRFSKEFIYLEDFKKIFPEEFEKYKKDNRQDIVNKMLNLIIEDSEYFADEFLEEDYYELIEKTYPELFRIYDLNMNKKFENNFEEYYHYEKYGSSIDIKEEMKKWKERDEEKRRIIEYEKQQLLGMDTEFLEEDEAKEYIRNNVKNENLRSVLVGLVDERYSTNMWYIGDFLFEKGALKWLIEFLGDRDEMPDAKELWDEFYKYIVDKIISAGEDISYDDVDSLNGSKFSNFSKDEVEEVLQKIAFFEIKNGNYAFSEKNFTESKEISVNEKILEACIRAGVLIRSGKWLYFISEDLQIYLCVRYLIEHGMSLQNVTKSGQYQNYFSDSEYKLFKMYKLIDEELYYKFCSEVAKEYLKKVDTSSRKSICVSFAKLLWAKVNLNDDFENDSEMSIVNDLEIILKVDNMFLIDFDGLFSEMDDDDLKDTLEVMQRIDDNDFSICIKDTLDYDNTYRIFEEIGMCDFMMELYKKTVELARR